MANRAPIITNERPAWHYEEPVTGRLMTYTVGYITSDLIRKELISTQAFRDIPCVALFAGKYSLRPVLIPVDILVHALEVAAEKEASE